MARDSSARRLWRAPAKVNLTLHVLGRRDDGYHELDSTVAFAGACDWLGFEPDAPLSLVVEGPTAEAAGPVADNLVLRAARALAERVGGLRLGRFRLLKRLPVAAGLGGGSSDAAAALRALAHFNGLVLDDERLISAAQATGSDVRVCLDPRARAMAGAGERVGAPLGMAPLPAVLANPGVGVATPRVFAGLGLAPGAASGFGAAPDLGALDAEAFFAALLRGRNDLQRSAETIAPEIASTLAALGESPGARLVRMSGSGATCFAIFRDRRSATAASRALKAARPDWWVRATWLR